MKEYSKTIEKPANVWQPVQHLELDEVRGRVLNSLGGFNTMVFLNGKAAVDVVKNY